MLHLSRGQLAGESKRGLTLTEMDEGKLCHVAVSTEQVTMPGPRMPSAGLLSLSSPFFLFSRASPDEWALYRRPRGTMDKLIKGAE
ncbi:hypothetical protein CEXT_487181 [Caerostris extrusa]|uniref:Uncharacterized protein n=1 Tax=Caerostris extrusa TaxID=172846 RepID=A0AAV4MFI5_CAEEX|nr:hypothetical protein CEXT_487181 [Caerostris extrusa]